MFAKIAAPFALAVAVLAASPAVQAADLSSVKVRFGDLDLSSAAGHAQLVSRIQQAASALCGGDEAHRSLGDQLTYRACRSDAIAAVTPQLQAALAKAGHDGTHLALSETTAN